MCVLLEMIAGEAADATRAILGDHCLRSTLYGGRGSIDVDAAAATWCALPTTGVQRRAIRCLAGNVIVGAVAVVAGEVSVFVAQAHRGRGFARAAINLLIADADSELVAYTVRENWASRRLLSSIAFIETGLQGQPDGLPTLVRYRHDNRRPLIASENRHGKVE